MKIKLSDDKCVGEGLSPYIIAELGSNHNGDMSLARDLIKSAHEAGADCVKFQSWSKETIFSKKTYQDNYFLSDDYRNKNTTLEEIVDAYSISARELLEMKQYADDLGINCISTPFSKSEVDFLVEQLDVDFIKVASMDANNYAFLDYIARTGKPIILSTGLASLSEIDEAVRTIESAGNSKLIILHCVSIYPPKDTEVDLKNIDTLRQLYPSYPVGFSDHSIGTCIPIASVAKGACVIEKHFTLDKTMTGWDHAISADPYELKEIVTGCHRVHDAMGSSRIRRVEPQERVDAFRRSIVTTRAIKKGEVIGAEMLDCKRPGTGIPPGYLDLIVGRKAQRDLTIDEIVQLEDV